MIAVRLRTNTLPAQRPKQPKHKEQQCFQLPDSRDHSAHQTGKTTELTFKPETFTRSPQLQQPGKRPATAPRHPTKQIGTINLDLAKDSPSYTSTFLPL